LWLRNTGTKGENYHQKLKAGMGPYLLGIETGHRYHVLLSYMYLVNGRVRRACNPDFGHFLLDYEDRIQDKIQHIWNLAVYPHHTNVLSFKGIEGFVSVGIGPLTYDERYVICGAPKSQLTGNLRSLARRMGTTLPLLPPCTKAERSYIKRFLACKPQYKDKDLVGLCEKFRMKADGKSESSLFILWQSVALLTFNLMFRLRL